MDLDGDGYSGVYTYDIDSATGLHVNQTGDAFPSDATQWFDQDGDGYGDNPSPANNADDCPAETGTSYIDFLGCFDDGDGYRDENEPAALRGDATQWRDSDFDGYGDNWGDPSWNETRDPSWPGEFVAGATNADYVRKRRRVYRLIRKDATSLSVTLTKMVSWMMQTTAQPLSLIHI